jgi:protein transport protein SEC24
MLRSSVVAQSFSRCCATLCRRRDTYERAELSCGTYEVVATQEYFARPAMPVIHVFLIDVGHAAVASGATAATCQCIEQVLDSLQGE